MKTFLKILLAAALALLAMPSLADTIPTPDAITGFGVTSTNQSTTRCYAIVPRRSANGGAPGVTYINAGSDSNACQLLFSKVTHVTTTTYTNQTVSIPVASTNGFASGDVVIIEDVATGSYTRGTLTTFTGATNLTLTASPYGGDAAIPAGSKIYRTVNAGQIQWGASTNGLGPARFIWVGQAGYPLMLQIPGNTAAAYINSVGGEYIR